MLLLADRNFPSRAVRRWIISAAVATGTILADVVAEILKDLHERRDRVSPRVVKRSQAPIPIQEAHDPADPPLPPTTPPGSSILD